MNQCEISSSKNQDLDSDAIQRASAEVEAAFNQHDAAALARHFTHNAIWVNAIYVMVKDETLHCCQTKYARPATSTAYSIMNSKEVCNGKPLQFISSA